MRKLILLGFISAFAYVSETVAMRHFKSLTPTLHKKMHLPIHSTSIAETVVLKNYDQQDALSFHIKLSNDQNEKTVIEELAKLGNNDAHVFLAVSPRIVVLQKCPMMEICGPFVRRKECFVSIFGEGEKIPNLCFSGWNNLMRITFGLGSSLKSLGCNAFSFSGIREIHIPDSVEKLGSYCFAQCRKLTRVTFGDISNLNHIGIGIFNDCPFKESDDYANIAAFVRPTFDSLSDIEQRKAGGDPFLEGKNHKNHNKKHIRLQRRGSFREIRAR